MLKQVKVLESIKLSQELWGSVKHVFAAGDTATYDVGHGELDSILDDYLMDECGCVFGERIVVVIGRW